MEYFFIENQYDEIVEGPFTTEQAARDAMPQVAKEFRPLQVRSLTFCNLAGAPMCPECKRMADLQIQKTKASTAFIKTRDPNSLHQ